MVINNYIHTPSIPIDEVANFIAAVQAAGGDVTGTLPTAYQDLLDDLGSDRSLDGRINLFATDSFTGCLVPFLKSFDGVTTRGNTSDTNNGPFVSGDWGLTTGLVGNGSTKYLSTGFAANVPELSQNNIGFWVWIDDLGTLGTNIYDIGATDLTSYNLFNGYRGATTIRLTANSTGTTVTRTPSTGFMWVGRSYSGDVKYHMNGVDYTATNVSNGSAAIGFNIFCFNSNGTPSGFCNKRLLGYGIGKYRNPTQRATLYAALQAFNTTIGR